jgi:hypothetical protein
MSLTMNMPAAPAVPERYRALIDRHGKSPWCPSRKALARVPDPLPAPAVHECGRPVEIVHHTDIYGRVYGEWPWMYRCAACDASVGMHPFTNIPLGTLADKELRRARKLCKQPFEQVWQGGRMSRTDAYQRLAWHLGIKVEQCHFGLFDAHQCRIAMNWALRQLRNGPSEPIDDDEEDVQMLMDRDMGDS